MALTAGVCQIIRWRRRGLDEQSRYAPITASAETRADELGATLVAAQSVPSACLENAYAAPLRATGVCRSRWRI